MSNKLYEETAIQNIGSSIRGKNGKPNGYKVEQMAAAIDAIPNEDPYIDRSIVDVVNSRVTKIGRYAFSDAIYLQTVDCSQVERIESYAFSNTYSLMSVNFPKCKVIGGPAFSYSAITSVNFPLVDTVQLAAFKDARQLVTADFGVCKSFETESFVNAVKLTTLIIRWTGIAMLAPNALDATPIHTGTGFIYVPNELVASYKTAASWSKYATQILPISQLP